MSEKSPPPSADQPSTDQPKPSRTEQAAERRKKRRAALMAELSEPPVGIQVDEAALQREKEEAGWFKKPFDDAAPAEPGETTQSVSQSADERWTDHLERHADFYAEYHVTALGSTVKEVGETLRKLEALPPDERVEEVVEQLRLILELKKGQRRVKKASSKKKQ